MIRMTMIERGLGAEISPGSLDAALTQARTALTQAAQDTLSMAGLTADAVQTVIFVGGSSMMGMVQSAMAELCTGARLETADVFTAVVDGLAWTLADEASGT
jgi:hypothetical chaperone protein